ncbi:OprO/OprP family phosphate-selective porin [Phenylobacterium sp.]|jgi:phosphate-selective porin OprO/OprP|uniref:OprO/OprP family phosphate-selective porin n=1 Tax=Phenylobacterium sp. TaxID=1871053 RepID=UPI002F402BA8
MRSKTLILAAASLGLAATAAPAKPATPPAPDPRDAEIQALKDEVKVLETKVDALEARAAQAATPPAAPPVVQTPAPPSFPTAGGATIVAGRPSIASADGRFTANLHALMQLDAADYAQATPGPVASDLRRGAAAADTAHARDLSSGSDFRRARFGVDGRAFGDWDYNLLLEFGGAGEEDAGHVQELWVQYSGLRPFHVRIGAFAPSLGLEDQGSTSGSLFLERPAAADIARGVAGGDFREGAEVWGGTDWWYVNAAVTGRVVGVVNSQATGVAQPFDAPLGFLGRLGLLPVHTGLAMLEVGVHSSYVERPADTGGPDTPAGAARYAITLQERPELRVDGTRLISTGGLDARHLTEVGFELSGELGPLFLQSEYERFRLERLDPVAGAADPSFHGYYVEGSYILTGERRRFNTATWAWDAPSVDHPFSWRDGTWGALEAALRYSDVDLNDHPGAPGTAPGRGAVRGGDQRIWSGGLNWHPNSFVKLMLDYQDVRIDRLSPSATTFSTPVGAQIGQHYHVVALRSQFAF